MRGYNISSGTLIVPEDDVCCSMRGALGFAAWLVQEIYVPCSHAPTHDVAPRAVTMAVATDAMICTMNLIVSFLVMVTLGY